jgi:NitT/TauT family transport system substrate-binding protein
MIERSPSLKPEVEVAKLKAAAPLPSSPATAQHGNGYSDKERRKQHRPR